MKITIEEKERIHIMKAELVVKGIIFDKKQGKILLIKRSKTDYIGADTWESAGGKIV